MQDPGDRRLRLARAALLTVLSVSSAAGAHVLGGGELPDLTPLGALCALALLVSTLCTRRPWRMRTLAPVLGLLQLGLHHGMALLAPSTGLRGSPAHGHAGHSDPAASLAAATVPMGDALATSTPMLLAHVLAVLATAATLVGADRAARAAWHWWTWVLPRLLGAVTSLIGPTAGPRADHHAPAWIRSVLLVAVVSGRGPPGTSPAVA